MKSILFLRNFSLEDKKKIETALQDYYQFLWPTTFSEEELLKLAPQADVLFGLTLSEQVLRAAKKAQLFQFPCAGVDRTNLVVFKGKNITVCNSHSNAQQVAEFAFSLYVALCKKIVFHDRFFRKGVSEKQFSTSLQGKNVLLLGYGHIGRKIGEFMRPFAKKITCYKQHPVQEEGITFTTNLTLALQEADIVFVALPLTAHTKHLLDEKALAHMKENAFLINVGRAGVIDEAALYTSLKEKKIAAAALDVWWQSPLPQKDNKVYPSLAHPFHLLDNIILSPYRAGTQQGAPHLDGAIENVLLFAQAKPLKNKVIIEEGY